MMCAGDATLEQDLGPANGPRRVFPLMQCSFVFASAACALKHLHTRLWAAAGTADADGLGATGHAAHRDRDVSQPVALVHGNITMSALCRCFDGAWRLQGCLDLGSAAGQVRMQGDGKLNLQPLG